MTEIEIKNLEYISGLVDQHGYVTLSKETWLSIHELIKRQDGKIKSQEEEILKRIEEVAYERVDLTKYAEVSDIQAILKEVLANDV